MKRYKPRSLPGAAQRVRNLEKQIEALETILRRWKAERILLAKLAAKGPAFFNPLEAFTAERVRDSILDQIGMRPDGSYRTESGSKGRLEVDK